MKFLHTADLHIGKSVNEFSMLEEQSNVLSQMLTIVQEAEVDAVILAGDIYDRSVPPAEAVVLFDSFLSKLAELGTKVFLISGNHDSPERLSFAESILKREQIYLAGSWQGKLKKVELMDEYGPITICLLPFVKPQTLQYYRQDKATEDQEATQGEAAKGERSNDELQNSIVTLLKETDLKTEQRNLLITHYFVMNKGETPEISDSEVPVSVGGLDSLDAVLFEKFDYVALGHLHKEQKIARETIRYSGSPVKYSFSEATHSKSVTIVEMREKGNVCIEIHPLVPLHDMRRIRGKLKELMDVKVYSMADTADYLEITLTDEGEFVDPLGTLRAVYPNIMQIKFEKNLKHPENTVIALKRENRTPLQLFEEFYLQVTGELLTRERREIMEDIIRKVGNR